MTRKLRIEIKHLNQLFSTSWREWVRSVGGNFCKIKKHIHYALQSANFKKK